MIYLKSIYDGSAVSIDLQRHTFMVLIHALGLTRETEEFLPGQDNEIDELHIDHTHCGSDLEGATQIAISVSTASTGSIIFDTIKLSSDVLYTDNPGMTKVGKYQELHKAEKRERTECPLHG